MGSSGILVGKRLSPPQCIQAQRAGTSSAGAFEAPVSVPKMDNKAWKAGTLNFIGQTGVFFGFASPHGL